MITTINEFRKHINETETHFFGPDSDMEKRAAMSQFMNQTPGWGAKFKNAKSFKRAVDKIVLTKDVKDQLGRVTTKPMNSSSVMVMAKTDEKTANDILKDTIKKFGIWHSEELQLTDFTENSFVISIKPWKQNENRFTSRDDYDNKLQFVMSVATPEQLKVLNNFQTGTEQLFLQLLNGDVTVQLIDDTLQLMVNDVEGDESQLEPEHVAYAKTKGWLDAFNENIKSINEDESNPNYMVFGNISKMSRMLAEMAELLGTDNLDEWAKDHIATSADDIEEVYNFLKSKK